MIAFVENISVFDPAIHNHTNAHQCQLRKIRLSRDQPKTPRFFDTSGRRSMASVLSSWLRYLARVEVGVSGKIRKPYIATGKVVRKSMTKSHWVCLRHVSCRVENSQTLASTDNGVEKGIAHWIPLVEILGQS